MEKFTKGGWIADIRVGCCAVYPVDSRDGWEQGLCSDDRNIYYSTYKNVAMHPKEWVESQEKIANAHLIAAAPEMYAALKLISDLSILDADKGLSSLVDELLVKARGESCGN